MILDRRDSSDKYAVVGDIHGSYYTLMNLVKLLGFTEEGKHPQGLRLVSVGDLHDRGGIFGVQAGDPSLSGAVNCIRWAMDWEAKGVLDVVNSNHGIKLAQRLAKGIPLEEMPTFGHGMDDTIADLHYQPDATELIPAVEEYLRSRPLAARYSGGPTGEIIVAHAGVRKSGLTATDVNNKRMNSYIYHFLYNRELEWFGSETIVVGHVITDGPVRQKAVRTDGKPSGEVIRIDTGAGGDGDGKLTAYLPHTDSFVTIPLDPRDIPDAERLARNAFDA